MSIYGCSGHLLVSLPVLYSCPPQQVSLTVFQQVKKLLLMIWRVGQRWTQGVLFSPGVWKCQDDIPQTPELSLFGEKSCPFSSVNQKELHLLVWTDL